MDTKANTAEVDQPSVRDIPEAESLRAVEKKDQPHFSSALFVRVQENDEVSYECCRVC